jgi:hypothetical protein
MRLGKKERRRGSFVYVGFVNFGEDALFVKVGKSDHPERRARRYNTHCPGGFASMYAARVPDGRNPFSLEYQVLWAIRKIPGAEMGGGEWVKIYPGALDSVFESLVSIVGDPYRVVCH